MKNIYYKAAVAALSVVLAFSAAACNETGENISSQNTVQTVDTPTTDTTDTEEEPDVGEHKDYIKSGAQAHYSNGLIVVEQDGHYRCMDVYSAMNADFYVAELHSLRDSISDRIKIYSMVIPTSCEYYCPSNMRSEITEQKDLLADLDEKLIAVNSINVWDTLNNHNAEPIYSRTDHHWTALGAYYATKLFAKAADVEYPDISEYEKVEFDNYVGTLVAFANSDDYEILNNDLETFTYYKPNNRYTTEYYDANFEYLGENDLLVDNSEVRYLTYLRGDNDCAVINTDVKNYRTLLIVKDDFGNPVVPFLTQSFEKIIVIDMDNFNNNLVSLIEKYKVTDILYVMSTFSVTGEEPYVLETIRTQPSGGFPVDEVNTSNVTTSSNVSTDSESITSDNYVYSVGLNNRVGVIETDSDAAYESIGDEYYSNDDENNGEYDNEYGGVPADEQNYFYGYDE
ncbi:MAG: hypothetical protein K2M82_01785 [Lachnospiraceae bacterium]|nr:hypothetical protein [Lachnospiraceae bacterium]